MRKCADHETTQSNVGLRECIPNLSKPRSRAEVYTVCPAGLFAAKLRVRQPSVTYERGRAAGRVSAGQKVARPTPARAAVGNSPQCIIRAGHASMAHLGALDKLGE